MKTSKFLIDGIKCDGCRNKILESLKSDFSSFRIFFEENILHLEGESDLNYSILENSIKALKTYSIIQASNQIKESTPNYTPLIVIFSYILGASILREVYRNDFQPESFMNNFMGSFFILFSLLKILNLDGFSTAYKKYDLVAQNFAFWAKTYPFVELILGIFYLMEFFKFGTNLVTFILMAIGLVGVIKSKLKKQEIKCACLGSFINLPLSNITIFENLLMAVMALSMLFI